MPLIKDLINIPEHVHQGDFVLKLSEGVSHAERTLAEYVVTEQLVKAFADALAFIQQAVKSGDSKAAYLHGSFGSGKSHFMAVLNLLLAGNTRARAIPELAGVVAQHGWTEGKKFLLVPYHMIGARDMESAILGHYAEHVRRLHPDAPVPGFYLAEGLFRDAQELRSRMGDESFFAQLNAGAGGGGWGELGASWDAISFEAAMLEPPYGEERARLIGDLISQYFSSYREMARGGEAYVSLDDGLAIMSRHARDLGYDAVILFLDELVLWLASHAADVGFVSREGTKLVKLVEATNAARPIPLVSFVARQRDLRELVGENLAGSMQLQFSDALRHWEARFHYIKLEDRNLPAIAERRILAPKSEAARQEMSSAFDSLMQARRDVLDTLLTTEADQAMFRKVYPFSPALVQTLIAVSAALQRERTALKLMLQLLVERRNDLELGQLIPVGDLWDAIEQGAEPFSEGMRLHFDNATKLYRQRLLPMLERQHGESWESVLTGHADPTAAKNLRNDARLLKTLLLSSLVPEVESLKGLTAQRLAALNHGTFRSPIPGREAQDVLRKIRDWAGEIGEIKLTDDANPVISLQITGVDIEPILRAAESFDNMGNRRRKIRELLFEQLQIPNEDGLFANVAFNWRGTKREVELWYENVRELADDRLRGRAGTWSVFLDFPFDEPAFTPNDDLARLNAYGGGTTGTLVWLPSFLSTKALNELGRLVILDHILQGERFDQYSTHLIAADRIHARTIARNQRDSLRAKLRSHLDVAYGIATEPQDAITHPLSADQQFRSLDPTFAPRPPVGANLRAALEDLLDQVFAHQFPAHPAFDTEIKPAVIRKVWQEVERAIRAPNQRELVADPATRRLVRSVVNPCRLGQMGETHLLIEPHWSSRFAQCEARESLATLTVADLRRWIDDPVPMGLPQEVQNLIILAFAAMTNRRFIQRGGPFEPSVDQMPNELELREQALPDASQWNKAIERASQVFGLVVPETLNAANVGRLIAEVREAALSHRDAVGRLVRAMREKAQPLLGGQPCTRQLTAESAQSLLGSLAQADDAALVSVFAQASIETSEPAVGRAIAQAKAVADAITTARWELFEAMGTIEDERCNAGQLLLGRLQEALVADEHVVPLASRLNDLHRDVARLLAATPPVRPAPPQPTPTHPAPPPVDDGTTTAPAPEPGKPGQHQGIVEERAGVAVNAGNASKILGDLEKRLRQEADLELTLSWRLQRKGHD